ncbi:hypothetical protein BJ508DRAFT_210556 [Ascobolus immersus RN42]|uniref:P-loop containing nucleoside triphosphate hydrolase protein n=1 Tax=Ascobolus immersus RN42 TaxID=1160509 RepID=A0A3N4I7U0_ASCIM|nr:hypothetical protein BJ508DRAFT_210556 [Ascobolus immersus RN42]
MKTPCPIPPDHVCFGMIKGATVKAHKVPTPRHATGPACWPQIPICLERVPGGCTLAIRARDCSRYEVGCLDLNTARGLADLMDRKMVRLQTRFCSRNKGQGEVPGMDFPNGPQQLSVYINVYGQERMAGMVGGHLRAKGITLHSPLYPDPVPYLNPHDPKNRALVNQHLNRFVEPTPTSVQTVTKTQDELKTDVITVLNHLERWKDLDEMEQDDKIVTPLLGHQKLGLAFMTARENDVEHNGTTGSLWEYTKPHYGKARWRNIITMDEIDTPPPQCYGGILADVMGLGKTLSILSLIASTTDKAVEYAKEPAHKGANGNQVTPVKTTLLIAPLSTISNWEEQVKQHIKPGTMSMYVYHGGNRQKDLEQLKNYDIVMTTYQIIAGEMGRFLKKNSTFKTLFGEFSFFRIVLDEAHMIREQNTSQFKGVVAIEAQRRWAVTGTPIQNRLDDLHALIAFIRLKPFDNKRVFKENIAVPFKLQSENCLERVRTLVDSITIRRQKDKINLPERKDKVVTLEMDSDQREIYEATRKQSDNRFRNVAKAGNLSGKAYVHILQAILRLRMISAHGRELLGEDEIAGMTSTDAIDIDEIEEKRGFVTPKDAYTVFSLMKDTGQDNCEICSTKIESQADKPKGDVIGYLTPCYHLICKNGCVETYNRQMAEKVPIEGREGPCCLCPNQVNTAEVFQLQEGGGEEVEAGEKAKSGKKSVRYRGPSVKVRKLISSLMENRTSGTPEEPVKSVVFSCWTSHMDLIGRALDDHGIQFVRLDGTMSRPSRSEVIEKFRNDPAIEVIIISIAAGGLGLNLTCAQRVYVMEPQFNPAAEAQAVDRVHRLGQKHIVYVTWYIMKDSFEDKILELQKKKQDIANLSLTGKCHDGKDLKRQRLAVCVILFQTR